MIELTFLKELVFLGQANQKNAIFVTIGIFQIKALIINQMSAIDTTAILNIKSVDYRYIISRISKCEAINLMQNIDLIKKSRTL